MSPAERDRYVSSTPTDFTTDYKHIPATSFDTSNVLAWLQSPTANGLFSPGFGSMLNTPNPKQQTTPTPTVSTSFFFSDVASLPKQPQTPAGATTGNNIICISPLASKKQHHEQTPVDLKDIFASPAERKFRSTSTSKDAPSLDAVVLAERDLMEDEDLNVLLQLASSSKAYMHTTDISGILILRQRKKTAMMLLLLWNCWLKKLKVPDYPNQLLLPVALLLFLFIAKEKM